MSARYLLACVVVLAAMAVTVLFLLNPMRGLLQKTIHIANNTVVAEVADTPATRARGLGGRAVLPQGRGMLFDMDGEAEWGFWMKDMEVSIDIVWLGADGTIVDIARSVAPETYPQVFKPGTPARFVLELPAGYMAAAGVGVGEKISL